MFSRSAAVVARGRTLSPLSPLSPLFFPGLNAAEVCQRNRSLMSGHRTGRLLGTTPTANLMPPLEDIGSPPPTAATFGYENTIMERLQAVLASPFSPGTFFRSMSIPGETTEDTAPNHKHTLATPQRGLTVPALKPRPKKRRPAPLPLRQPNRLSVSSPLSPFHYGIMAARLAIIKICPSRMY